MKTELSILNKNTQKDEFGNRVWKEGEVITAMKENACERMRDIVDELHTLYINDNSKDFAVSINGVKVEQAGARNLGEMKHGVNGNLNPAASVWGNVGVQLGDNGYNDTAMMVGLKYKF